jgi:hypothetical protein
MFGVVKRAEAVSQRVRSLARLNLELAGLESKKKAIALGIGVGLAGLALLLALYAIGFGLAAAAVGLSEQLPLWASLLIVAAALLLTTAIVGFLAVHYLRKLSSPLPTQAIEEMERAMKTVESHA